MSEDFEYQKIAPVPLTSLSLDRENPRLVREGEDDPLDLIETAQRLLDLDDPLPIARLVVAYGYFSSDPVIAFADAGELVVVEGNRRLLAVQLLKDEELRERLVVDQEWGQLAQSMGTPRSAELESIPTLVVPDRAAARPMIGFRHIIGIKKWRPYEKAVFVAQLVLHDPDPENAVHSVSLLTGESEGDIRGYLRNYLVLQQCTEMGIAVDEAKDAFGVFTRLLNNGNVASFLKLEPSAKVSPESTAVLSADPDQVKVLFSLLYGADGEPRAFTDSRRITEFGKVLASPEALENLVATRDLSESLVLAGGVHDRVSEQLEAAIRAVFRVRRDLQLITPNEDNLRLLDELADQVRNINLPPDGPMIPDAEDATDGYDLDTPDADED